MRLLSRLLVALFLVAGLGYGSYAFGKYVLSERLFGPDGSKVQHPKTGPRSAGANIEALPENTPTPEPTSDDSASSGDTSPNVDITDPLPSDGGVDQTTPVPPVPGNAHPETTPRPRHSVDNADTPTHSDDTPDPTPRPRRHHHRVRDTSNDTPARDNAGTNNGDSPAPRRHHRTRSEDTTTDQTTTRADNADSTTDTATPRRHRSSDENTDTGNGTAAPRVPVDSGNDSPAPHRRRRERAEGDGNDSPAPRTETPPRRHRENADGGGDSPVPVPEGNTGDSPVPVPG